MQINICVDPNDEKHIRAARSWEELNSVLADTLNTMEGPCLTQVAVLAGVNVQTLVNIRKRRRKPNIATMTVLVSVLAPGHDLMPLRTSCAVRRPAPPILPEGWRVHPDNAKYAYRGQDVKLVSELVGKQSAA